MKWMKIATCMVCIGLMLVGCGNKIENESKNETGDKIQSNGTNDEKQAVLATEVTDIVGTVSQNMIFDYREYYEDTYEWLDDVWLPIDKPENANVKFDEYNLVFGTLEQTQMDEYVANIVEDGYAMNVYDNTGSGNEKIDYMHYVFYKDNIVISMCAFCDYTSVYVMIGNVIGSREVSVTDVKNMLGEEYTDSIVLQLAYDTVAEAGYYEFLVILPEYYQNGNCENEPYYVITDEKQVLLCEQGFWNPIYPMSVILMSDNDKTELTINYNDLPDSRSGAEIYPMMCIYELQDGGFERIESVNLDTDKIIVGKVEDKEIKYYVLKEKDNYDFRNERSKRWEIDSELAIIDYEIE